MYYGMYLYLEESRNQIFARCSVASHKLGVILPPIDIMSKLQPFVEKFSEICFVRWPHAVPNVGGVQHAVVSACSSPNP